MTETSAATSFRTDHDDDHAMDCTNVDIKDIQMRDSDRTATCNDSTVLYLCVLRQESQDKRFSAANGSTRSPVRTDVRAAALLKDICSFHPKFPREHLIAMLDRPAA